MTAPTEEEWDAWRDHPITAWLMAGMANASAAAKAQWMEAAWATACGSAQPIGLEAGERIRTRAEAYADLATLSYADACGLHPEENTHGR